MVYQSVFWPVCILVFRIGNKSGKIYWGSCLGVFTRGICWGIYSGILLGNLLGESAGGIYWRICWGFCWNDPVKFIRHEHSVYRPLQWHPTWRMRYFPHSHAELPQKLSSAHSLCRVNFTSGRRGSPSIVIALPVLTILTNPTHLTTCLS